MVRVRALPVLRFHDSASRSGVIKRTMEPIGRSEVEVRQLRAFLAVVEHGTVSAAATALGLAQSTVSESVAALERAIGASTMFRRRGARHPSLTPAGDALLPFARSILLEIDAAHVAIARVTRTASASIDVIGNESVITYLLAPVLGALRKRWTKTQFAVSVVGCADGRARVAEGRCDLALLLEGNGQPAPGIEVAHQGSQAGERVLLADRIPLLLFASPAHPLAQARARSAIQRHAVAPFAVFVSDAAGDFYDLLRRYFAADRMPGPRLDAAGSIDGVKRGVIGDRLALGVLPRYAVADDLQRGHFVALAPQPEPPTLMLHAHFPRTKAVPHPALVELVQQLRQAPQSDPVSMHSSLPGAPSRSQQPRHGGPGRREEP